jgi:hypothetical protein
MVTVKSRASILFIADTSFTFVDIRIIARNAARRLNLFPMGTGKFAGEI